jgi:LmbE family N-acetylglucosaminyl deacetylase
LDTWRGRRLAVVAPHPDDETLAAGGLVAHWRAEGGDVKVVVLTHGDASRGTLATLPEYRSNPKPGHADFLALGRLRAFEAPRAAAKLGLAPDALVLLGFPDLGLADLWQSAWTVPYTAPGSGASAVPYAGSRCVGRPYTGESLATALAAELRDFDPHVVVCPHPRDSHIDHRAAARFTVDALAFLRSKAELWTFVFRREEEAVFAPKRAADDTRDPLVERALTFEPDAESLARKQAAAFAYRSQLRVFRGLFATQGGLPELYLVQPPRVKLRDGESVALLVSEEADVPDVEAVLTGDGLVVEGRARTDALATTTTLEVVVRTGAARTRGVTGVGKPMETAVSRGSSVVVTALVGGMPVACRAAVREA